MKKVNSISRLKRIDSQMMQGVICTSSPLFSTSSKRISTRSTANTTSTENHLSFDDLLPFLKMFTNLSHSNVKRFFDSSFLLTSVHFDHKHFTVDELHVASVLILYPNMAFVSQQQQQQGLQVLFEFVSSVRSLYSSKNPYHGFAHAVCVLQFSNFVLHQPDVVETTMKMGQNKKAALLLAALCHDVGHDGWTNALHRNSVGDVWVERYGKESVMERMHAHLSEQVLEKLFAVQVSWDRTEFLTLTRTLILSTDMEKHFDILAGFALAPTSTTLLLSMVLKIADISNVMRDFEESVFWAKQLDAEWKLHPALAGAAETSNTMPLAKSVTSFATMFALPLVDALRSAGMSDTSNLLVQRIESNLALWAAYN